MDAYYRQSPDSCRSVRYAQLIDVIARRLQRGGCHFGHGAANARDEAWYLVAAAAAVEPQSLRPGNQAGPDTVVQASQWCDERIRSRRPLSHLTGWASFYGLHLKVSQQVLVPRSPIGELLLDGLDSYLPILPGRIADVGTGSGSLAIAASLAFPQARVDALDISEAALALAEENAQLHGVQERVQVLRSDGLAACAGRRYDLILSNPPYVPWQEYLALPPEYHHEPRLALVSHDDGLGFARSLLREAPRHLGDEGLLVVEVGNTAEFLMQRWPDFPAVWPRFRLGGHGVFIIGARELADWRRRHPAL